MRIYEILTDIETSYEMVWYFFNSQLQTTEIEK